MQAFQDWLKTETLKVQRKKMTLSGRYTEYWRYWDTGKMAFATMARSTVIQANCNIATWCNFVTIITCILVTCVNEFQWYVLYFWQWKWCFQVSYLKHSESSHSVRAGYAFGCVGLCIYVCICYNTLASKFWCYGENISTLHLGAMHPRVSCIYSAIAPEGVL